MPPSRSSALSGCAHGLRDRRIGRSRPKATRRPGGQKEGSCAFDRSLAVFRLVIGAPKSILLVESHQAGAGMGLGRLSACFALALTAGSPAVGAAPSFGGCPAFPADNYWNTRVDNLPLHPSSMAWGNSIGAAPHLPPDCRKRVRG